MNNPIRVYFNPDFVASCTKSLFDNPFWDEDSDGNVNKIGRAHV